MGFALSTRQACKKFQKSSTQFSIYHTCKKGKWSRYYSGVTELENCIKTSHQCKKALFKGAAILFKRGCAAQDLRISFFQLLTNVQYHVLISLSIFTRWILYHADIITYKHMKMNHNLHCLVLKNIIIWGENCMATFVLRGAALGLRPLGPFVDLQRHLHRSISSWYHA